MTSRPPAPPRPRPRSGAGPSHSPLPPRRRVPLPPRREPSRAEQVRRFVRHHGWRAYALPALVVVTIVALVSPIGPVGHRAAGHTVVTPTPSSLASPAPTAESSGRLKVDDGSGSEAVPGDALPGGAAYTKQGAGTFRVIPGATTVLGSGPRKTFAIEVENGITGVDLTAFASTVMTVLADKRSWAGVGTLSLQRVNSDSDADFRVSLTSSYTVRTLCGYDQKIETSCYEDDHGPPRVNLNNARWVRGDVQFGQDLDMYRIYMVNHETGHALGHAHSFSCLPDGLAPVMMQQTITLRENQGQGSKVCQPNVWPYPPGLTPAQAVTT